MSTDSITATGPSGAAPPAPAERRLGKLASAVRSILEPADERAIALQGALFAFLVRVASAGILYLGQVVLARWMGAGEYGIYVSVWVWVMVLGGFAHLGLSVTMIRRLPEYAEHGDVARLRGLAYGGRRIALASSLVVTLLALGGLLLFGDGLSATSRTAALIGLACIPIVTLSDMQDGIGRACRWLGIALLPPYVLRPMLVLLAMLVAHHIGLAMDARTAAGALVVAVWGAALVQTILIERRIRSTWPGRERIAEPGPWLATSFPLLVVLCCEMVLQNADVLVVAHFLTPADVGVYYAAAKTMSLILFVHFAVGSAVANRFTALNARGDRKQLEAFVRDAVGWTFWPSLAGAVLILLLGKPLLHLFGPQFADGYGVMCVLVLGFLVRSAVGPAEFLLNMLGQQRACALVLLATAAMDIALNVLLVPRLGLVGAAAATALSMAGAAVCYCIIARRRLGLHIGIWSRG